MDNKSSKIIAIVALVVAVVGLSVGFAAFSSVLTIESSAEVAPQADTFKVGFSVSDSDLVGGDITPVVSGATADKVTLANEGNKATITGLKANFTEPGQSATYNFYVYNDSPYTAYLNTIKTTDGQQFKTCAIPEGSAATQGLVTAACGGISLTVQVGGDTYDGSETVTPNTSLTSKTAVPVTVTIAYNGTNRADGPFTVDFGNVELHYSTAQ